MINQAEAEIWGSRLFFFLIKISSDKLTKALWWFFLSSFFLFLLLSWGHAEETHYRHSGGRAKYLVPSRCTSPELPELDSLLHKGKCVSRLRECTPDAWSLCCPLYSLLTALSEFSLLDKAHAVTALGSKSPLCLQSDCQTLNLVHGDEFGGQCLWYPLHNSTEFYQILASSKTP